uniref:DDE Tnp4 domain-containing protein n=1 Tax=Cucumis melo TaxID=3656 RepID=A0A9I9EKL5_CUCME
MDPHEIATVVSVFTIAQRQMLLILEALLHDNKRIITSRSMADLESTEYVDVEEMVALFLHNCLGALDGTYIKVNVSAADRPRYRTRKGEVATNVLDVCDTKGDFVFILAGWEGSVADSRIMASSSRSPKHSWTHVEEAYLVDCLVDLVNAGGGGRTTGPFDLVI